MGKGPDGTREAHSHFRPTRLEANSVFRWPWPSQGLLGSTVRTSLSSPLPSPVALGPCLWGGGSLQPGQSRCAGSGGWPGAERLQLTGLQPGGHSWRTLCLGETGLLGRTAALSPWGWLQPRAPPLAEPSRAPEGGLELTSSARTPLQLCKTPHESLPVLNTRLCPGCGEGVDAPDGPAAVLVRRRQLSGPGAGRAGPWGEAASGRGCPGICPLPGSQGCPGEAPGHGGVQQEENLVSAEQLGPALWSSRWRKPRSCLFQRPWMGLPRPAVPPPSSCPPATARAAARLRGVTSSPAALWPPWT